MLAILISNHYTYIDVEVSIYLTDNWNILLEWLQLTKYVRLLIVSGKIMESVHSTSENISISKQSV